MEEIDIIELLKRVKEGKAPKKIEIKEYRYELNEFGNYFRVGLDGKIYYLTDELSIFDMIIFNTKIKILDKPIIEEFEVTDTVPLPHQFRDKIKEYEITRNEAKIIIKVLKELLGE